MMKRREAFRKGNMIGLRYGRRLRVLAKMIMLDRLHNAQEGKLRVSESVPSMKSKMNNQIQ